ncbi:HTH_48 domain-containing protein [Trichonephila clavipes]|nr:HTH_48 domain-containing protein [Trichonephila clavipes]
MCENTDQQICMKFCVKLGKTGTETYEMKKTAFGENAMSRARFFEWLRRFKEDRQSVNRRSLIWTPFWTPECHISVGSCDEILRKDLNMRRVSAKFLPRLLTEDQQFQRLATSSDLFQSESDDPEFMKLIITGDESWPYGYDPERKKQSSQ